MGESTDGRSSPSMVKSGKGIVAESNNTGVMESGNIGVMETGNTGVIDSSNTGVMESGNAVVVQKGLEKTSDLEKCYNAVISDISKLSFSNIEGIDSIVNKTLGSRLDRLKKKLGALGDDPVVIDPLPKPTEPGYDIWDLKKRELQVKRETENIHTLFQNETRQRWLNTDLLGDRLESLELLRKGTGSHILADKFGIEMTRKHLGCLDGPHWLNDEVINFYIGLIQERNDALVKNMTEGIPRCLCFNTFFFDMLSGADDPRTQYNYKAVERWTTRKKVDVFSVDILLIPVHKSKTHWCLGVVDMRPESRCIYMFDSLGGSHQRFFINIRKWLQDEHLHKKGKPLDNINDWRYNRGYQAERAAPRQHNGYDCGVFLCQYAECISIGKIFDFTQRDIRDKREIMIQQILRGSIFE
ncbi:Ulp1 protease C-terminal catalytic domain-containing protein [Babesia ovis]|uniref:Ulp1 protease C-terminal catalytic domain-containing protein n=1 Tax=Babesia ovis TaxID=5869 RepID=A0A9W5TDV8_BABOV|nr:Ulp1 protease C-terminal catalytic domain-containing protein [Babesia ovis]